MFRKHIVYETPIISVIDSSNNDNISSNWIIIDFDPSPISVVMDGIQEAITVMCKHSCERLTSH
jgi:hypothetical protein